MCRIDGKRNNDNVPVLQSHQSVFADVGKLDSKTIKFFLHVFLRFFFFFVGVKRVFTQERNTPYT